jgi:RNA polymerase sigma factor (TIGR02999 family)
MRSFAPSIFLSRGTMRSTRSFAAYASSEVRYSPDLTERLRRCSAGDHQIAEAILAEVLPELHRIAVQALRRERYMAPLDPTELINEVWIRNFSKDGWKVESRNHFFALAAQAMRWVLVDNARHRLAQRRRDIQGALPIDEALGAALAAGTDLEEIVHIGVLMEELEKCDRVAARVFDLHYFAGFSLEKIAEISGLTLRQVRSRWDKGRNWLKLRL